MAQDFAQGFVDHREVAFRADAIAKLTLDSGERAFNVAALVVMGHVLFLLEREVVKRFLESATDLASRA